MWVLLRPHNSEEAIMQVIRTIDLDIAKSASVAPDDVPQRKVCKIVEPKCHQETLILMARVHSL